MKTERKKRYFWLTFATIFNPFTMTYVWFYLIDVDFFAGDGQWFFIPNFLFFTFVCLALAISSPFIIRDWI